MQNDDHLIFEAFKKKWKLTSMDPKQAEAEFGKENVKVTPKGLRNGKDMIEVNVTDEDAESADEKKERVQRGWDINKKRWAKWKAENPEAAAKHAARKAGKSENAENEPHGYPQGITAIQNTLINELKKRGFQLTRISHEDKERDKYPTVFMSRKSNFMHSVVEISGMGEINGEHYKAYLAGSNNSENAENARPDDVSNEIRIKLGQAYNIVKGLIVLLDKTPIGQTPYNEMAITHLVNLQEDLKELTMILQDRMLKQSEDAEGRSNAQHAAIAISLQKAGKKPS